MRTTQRHRHTVGHRTKLHLRVRQLGGRTLRILSPRPGTDVRLATNRYHDTWHVLSDRRGAKLLAHLMWGLSYQRRPGTVALLDDPFLVNNPFDADPSDPVLIAPTALSPIDRGTVRTLARVRRRLGPSDRTVRLHSWGLAPDGDVLPGWRWPTGETFRREHGMLVLRASREALRWLAVELADLHVHQGTGYEYFAYGPRRQIDGEVQVFDDFRARVGEARRARGALGLGRGRLDEGTQIRVWKASEALRDARFGRTRDT